MYYRTVFRRENKFLNFCLDLFLNLCSWPRLLLEVFIRKNFGERYFKLSSAVTVAILLMILPALTNQIFSSVYSSFGGYGRQESNFWGQYATWYAFLIAFLYFSFLRWREVKRNPSVYNFGRFSLCTGDINSKFFHVRLFGKSTTPRQVETILEPALFFVSGLLLIFMGQKLGWLLFISSIFYSLGYAGAYRNGDNFVLDRIDEMILNEEMEDSFVNDEDSSQTRGVRFYTKKPNDADLRRKVADTFIEDTAQEDIAEVI